MMNKALTLDGIKKSFGAVEVLKELNLDIPVGSHIALLGKSGSGKTTLLRIIAGLEKATHGSVNFCGQIWQSTAFFTPPEKRKIGFVFQDYALFPHLTVAKNILFGLSQKKHRLQDTLQLLSLEGLENRFPHELSGGQQQRVAIARAVIRKPDVLLFDEPFSNLDEVLKDQLRISLKNTLRQLNITSILVTHDVRDAFMICDQIALLNQGEIVQLDTPTSLYKHPKNEWVASFLGKLNCLTINGKAVYFRPEEVSIGENMDLEAQVVDVQFIGTHYQTKLRYQAQEFTVNTNTLFQVGLHICFSITQQLIWHE